MEIQSLKEFKINQFLKIIENVLYGEQLNENSKNSPILELFEKNKICVLFFGPPGAGKSTFIKDKILPINSNFKIISTDEINKVLNRNTGTELTKFIPKSYELGIKYLDSLRGEERNVIYDTTGMNFSVVMDLYTKFTNSGYKTIIIHLLVSKKTSISRVEKRNKLETQPLVSKKYIEENYRKTTENIKSYISELRRIDPDFNYYLIINLENKLNYYQVKDENVIIKRDGSGGTGYSKQLSISLDDLIEILA